MSYKERRAFTVAFNDWATKLEDEVESLGFRVEDLTKRVILAFSQIRELNSAIADHIPEEEDRHEEMARLAFKRVSLELRRLEGMEERLERLEALRK